MHWGNHTFIFNKGFFRELYTLYFIYKLLYIMMISIPWFGVKNKNYKFKLKWVWKLMMVVFIFLNPTRQIDAASMREGVQRLMHSKFSWCNIISDRSNANVGSLFSLNRTLCGSEQWNWDVPFDCIESNPPIQFLLHCFPTLPTFSHLTQSLIH